MDLGDKIKTLRIKQGLTLEEVGTRVGVGKSTVRKWENGQIANMRRDKIAKIASALNVSPAYLMGWTDSKKHPVSDIIRNRVGTELENANIADIDAARANMNIDLLDRIAKGEGALIIEDAIEASEMLGITLNDLLGIQNSAPAEEPERDRITKLFLSLTEENQKKLIDYAILLLTAQQAGRDSQG